MKKHLLLLLLLISSCLASCGSDDCRVCDDDSDCGGGRTCVLFTDYITRCARPGEKCKGLFNSENSPGEPNELPNLAIADLNQDSIPDMVSISAMGPNAGQLMIQEGNSNGGFSPAEAIPGTVLVSSVHVLDADEDGIMDIATLAQDSRQIQLHRGLGNGRFASAVVVQDA